MINRRKGNIFLLATFIVSALLLSGCNILLKEEPTISKEEIETIYKNDSFNEELNNYYVNNYYNDLSLSDYRASKEYLDLKSYHNVINEIYDEVFKSVEKDINKRKFNKESLISYLNNLNLIDNEKDKYAITKDFYEIIKRQETLLLENLNVNEEGLTKLKENYNNLELDYLKYVNTIERSILLSSKNEIDYYEESDRILLSDVREQSDGNSSLSEIIKEAVNLNRIHIIKSELNDLESYVETLKSINLKSESMKESYSNNIEMLDSKIELIKQYISSMEEKNYKKASELLEEIKTQ